MTRRSFIVSLGGEAIRLRADGDAALADRLGALSLAARAFAGAPDLELQWASGRGVLRRDGRVVRRSRSLDALVLWTEWAATREAIRRLSPKTTLIHAAWVAKGPRGVLLAGPHGAGKTTLGAALALRRRWTVFGDDVAVVSRTGSLRGLERPLRLKPGFGRRLPELAPGRGTRLVPVRRFSQPGPARLRAIVLLGSKRGPLRVRRVDPGLAVATLARFTLNFRESPEAALKTLAGLASRGTAWTMSGGTVEERCAKVDRLLR